MIRLLTLISASLLLGVANAQSMSQEELKNADLIAGQQTWQQYCAFCHTAKEGQANMAGPNLAQLFKRKVGSKADFAYSDALNNDGRDWTPELLAEYVRNPGETIPGNNMPAVDLPADKVVPLVGWLMRETGSVNWDDPKPENAATGGLDAELKSSRPEFWAQYMENSIKFTLPRDNGQTYSFVAYFNEDGSITGNNRGMKGMWRMRDKRTFCYALERVGVHPYEWMHCLQPKADKDLVYGEVTGSFAPVKGHEEFQIEVSWLEGRPHPLEGDAHPEYWTFLFNNTSRYEIKVNKETVIVDARFNEDKTISSPQGATGEWYTKGPEDNPDTMCYYIEGVPGIEGQLSECFALVLMFNPRVGARWPARFEQGNTYWAEITEGRP